MHWHHASPAPQLSGNIQDGPKYIEITGLSVNLATLNDISSYAAYLPQMLLQFGGGNDTVNGSSCADYLLGCGGADTIFGNGGDFQIEIIGTHTLTDSNFLGLL